MPPLTLIRLNAWFDDYSRTFMTGDPQADAPLILKVAHTRRVADNIRHLSRAVGLDAEATETAEMVGWLHDLGRFEQYRRYHTFRDGSSANHALLGIAVLEETGLLTTLPAHREAAILDAIRFHNAPALPPVARPGSWVFMRLIRDADKLDIWKIFGDLFRHDPSPDATVVQHLPDRPTWNPRIVEAIAAGRNARIKHMQTLNDFKLIQLSWVFDLNFSETAVQARKRADLLAIASTLPDHPIIRQTVARVMARLMEAAVPEGRRA